MKKNFSLRDDDGRKPPYSYFSVCMYVLINLYRLSNYKNSCPRLVKYGFMCMTCCIYPKVDAKCINLVVMLFFNQFIQFQNFTIIIYILWKSCIPCKSEFESNVGRPHCLFPCGPGFEFNNGLLNAICGTLSKRCCKLLYWLYFLNTNYYLFLMCNYLQKFKILAK